MTNRYNIVRFYAKGQPRRVIAKDVSLEEAQAHCRDPETCSFSATSSKARALTRQRGSWFDGYEAVK